ncbi:Formylmethanofuran dehydrogenase subunit A [hydrothermal vent metagenome]|uniref:Formylmethanofuran dehydrogenase subunit A n=1 Tax=hydrothermal vent metagenome TaxID=652676 RepID=A0A3B1BLG1_9ZZZZ
MGIRIDNGEVVDPANKVNRRKISVHIKDGKIVGDAGADCHVIDATDCVVMAGGVDIHTHVAGPKVNFARLMLPEDHRYDHVSREEGYMRSGAGGVVATTFTTGYRYSEMGYTTIIEPAVPPLGARHAHEELVDIPQVDKAIFTLLGNSEIVFQYLENGEQNKLQEYIAWIIDTTKAYSVKIVNPGGANLWKYCDNLHNIDEKLKDFDITPRDIVTGVSDAMTALKMPHPLHLHCNNLGVQDSYKTVMATVDALEGRQIHLTHLQFNSYGSGGKRKFSSEAPRLADMVNANPNITIDVGQVLFGRTVTITADGPFEYHLHKMTGSKWYNGDVECEDGCGVVPYDYKRKSFVNCVQWAAGLELFLLVDDPWRVYLTTDHPNGGPFISYPYIIRMLMDKDFRKEQISKISAEAGTEIPLKVLEREYSLEEIAIITRAGTAKRLGLADKGHIGIGADADVTIYRKSDNYEEMFAKPAYVIKDGEIVVKDGKVVKQVFGKTFHVKPETGAADIQEDLEDFFRDYYTINIANYPVGLEYLPNAKLVECGK